MNKSFMKKSILSYMNNFLVILPTPVNISYFWNFGSLLGMFFMIQFITGFFLSMHYISNINMSFYMIIHIMKDVNYGWLMRLFHMNGASFFFICVYLHIGRGLYYGSFKMFMVWFLGVLILLMMMGIAFMGYVLPWGQMSFWGATVITNLLSAIPYFGKMIVEWLWGGFSVNNATLNRFYSFHFIFPFILMFLIIFHLIFLHEKGSNNPLGLISNYYKIIFHNYFMLKDLLGFFYFFFFLFLLVLYKPYILSDPENFIEANSMLTPLHIQPEWYFLFAYTILRSIPNKLGGVLGLLMSILILLFSSFLNKMNFSNLFYYPFNQFFFWCFVNIFMLLTWLGGCPVEYPYMILSQMITLMYFLYFFFDSLLKFYWDFNF